jgi:hypothetical protein
LRFKVNYLLSRLVAVRGMASGKRSFILANIKNRVDGVKPNFAHIFPFRLNPDDMHVLRTPPTLHRLSLSQDFLLAPSGSVNAVKAWREYALPSPPSALEFRVLIEEQRGNQKEKLLASGDGDGKMKLSEPFFYLSAQQSKQFEIFLLFHLSRIFFSPFLLQKARPNGTFTSSICSMITR